jgi:hypothetical protein
LRKREVILSKFYCTQCGKEGIPLARSKGKQREPGHLKNLWCPHCRQTNNFVEIKPYGEYTKECFDLEFKLNNFTVEGKRKEDWKELLKNE